MYFESIYQVSQFSDTPTNSYETVSELMMNIAVFVVETLNEMTRSLRRTRKYSHALDKNVYTSSGVFTRDSGRTERLRERSGSKTRIIHV